MADEIQGLLDRLNALVFGKDSRMGFAHVSFDDIREQDINANAMPTEMFNALVGNIKKNGVLESVPLCATRQGSDQIEIVSGHHRIRAARQAGQAGGVVIVCRGLTDAEIKAKQLAHNSISGTSDPQIVKEIFEQIDSLSLQMEAYIDTKELEKVPDPLSYKPLDVNPLYEAKTVTVVFLPTEFRDFDKAVDLLSPKPDTVYIAHKETFDQFKKAVKTVQDKLEIKSVPTAIAEMAALALEHLNAIEVEHGGQ